MKPTVSDINNHVRALLVDTVNGGEIFDDTTLAPFVAQSVRELFRVLRGSQDPFVLTENYFVLPSEVSVFDPATANITNLAELEFVEWTIPSSFTPITACSVTLSGANSPYATVTATSHGVTVGSYSTVCVYGISGFDIFNSPNGSWVAYAVDANTLRLGGCTAAGTYDSGGYVVPLNGAILFEEMEPRDRIENLVPIPGTPDQTDEIYAWEGGVFHFYPSGQNRLLRITYRTSGSVNLASTSVVPIDDSLDYLAVRTAGLAASSYGATARGAELLDEALGPTRQADGSGGILGTMLRASIRNLQRITYRRPPFRARRNNPNILLY